MDIKLPGEAAFIMNTLLSKGFEAFIVGGCVRDSLLGRKPEDWDICTSARPMEVMEVFSPVCPVVPTGIKHGTVTLVIRGSQFEVTTYRIEGDYTDGRRPDSVCFTYSLIEDLGRRDFTINAMAYNEARGLVDPFGGLGHLDDKLIICVGNADDRMREDYLRALRAVRFGCQLGFSIDEDTIKAIIKNNMLIKNISMERIRDELIKILLSNRAGEGIELLNKIGLLKDIIPELYPCLEIDDSSCDSIEYILDQTKVVLDNTPVSLIVRLAALVHSPQVLNQAPDCNLKSSQAAAGILRRLKFDSSTINRVSTLIREFRSTPSLSGVDIKRFIDRVGVENLDSLFHLRMAYNKCSFHSNEDFQYITRLKQECSRIIEEKHPLTIKDLDINGYDLIKLGFWPGREIGMVLDNLLEAVLENPELNKNNILLDISKKYL